MSSLEPFRPPSLPSRRPGPYLSRRAERALAATHEQSLIRLARVACEELVSSEKLRAVDHLAETAMIGQAMLAKWRETLAGPDPMLADELRFFTDVARLGKGEIIVDTIAAFRRQ